jgi:hypothetical protein
MPKCSAFTAHGAPCSNNGHFHAYGGIGFCGIHYNQLIKLEAQNQGNQELTVRMFEEQQQRARERLRMREMFEEGRQLARQGRGMRGIPEVAAVPPRRFRFRDPLREHAEDPQNVHRKRVVDDVMSCIEVISKIPVPSEYRWNMESCSKTPGEIIAECSLSIRASRNMMDLYTRDDTIYELGKGIYGRTMDHVWQYIKNSDDKGCLCKILRTELEDNIGMCMQGNLTRLCNVLSGYLEGAGPKESVSETLGREFPKLLDIEDVETRLKEANAILDRMNVHDKVARDEWIAPLLH